MMMSTTNISDPDLSRASEANTQPPPEAIRSVTVDVEEYFHIEAAHVAIRREEWDTWPSRVEHNTDLLLTLFDRLDRRGTFFILGHVARKHPGLAKRIADAGHEIASHGTGHDRLHRLNRDSFREDLTAGKQLLEDQTGHRVLGYRAPTFSVVAQTAWAIDVLIESGFQYDASVFPVRHPWYGVPTAPTRPFRICAKPGAESILEIPPLTLDWEGFGPVRGRHLPVAGGGYFRLIPLWFMKRGLRQAREQNRPAILYFHPWEFDPGIPRMPLPLTGRLRTYTGLATAEAKLETILRQPGRWVTLAESLDELDAIARSQPVFCLAKGN